MGNRKTEAKHLPTALEVLEVHTVVEMQTTNGAIHVSRESATEIGCTLDATLARDLTCKHARMVETGMAVRLSDGTVRMLGAEVQFSPTMELEARLLRKLDPEERALIGYLPEPWKKDY